MEKLFLHGLSPSIVKGIFKVRKNACKFRNFQVLYPISKKTTKFGTVTVTTKKPQINLELNSWQYQKCNLSEIFNSENEKWKGETCPCIFVKHAYKTSISCKHNHCYISFIKCQG